MFYLNKLFDLVSDLSFEAIKVKSHLCTKVRSPHSQCQKCIEICPQDAITIEQKVSVDQEKCDKCGHCYNVCPVGVFVIQEGSDSKLISEAAGIADFTQELIISCQKVRVKRNERKKEIKVKCLARLSEEILISIFKLDYRYLLLKNGKCDQCELNGLELIKKTVKNSNNILSLFDNEKRIWLNEIENNQIPNHILRSSILNEDDVKGDTNKDCTKDANTEVINRRQLFNVLKSEIKKSFNKNNEDSNRDESSFREKEIPVNRKMLLDFMQEFSEEQLINSTKKQTIFWDLELAADCDFCGSCVTLCPTSALEIIKEEERKEILFTPAFCTGCKLCQEICVLDAIRLSNQRDLKTILNNEQVSVQKGVKKVCSGCGDEFFATEDEKNKCFGCAYQANLMN
ncbi:MULTISPECIES: 4Fe-4S dicluster domain-containing protein [unclassified Candidatus Frackibacter]|uniref:4Fe-4S dicluster domain-containing protein n=1 Tax=unclassified Candidatus Frackibacter TaxID=2648818 RepID=UPI00088760FF|nr:MULTISPECIES: 4Fe-4S dicluster domain-containing protein [unclassified Candidatus Frackibacter]SDC00052.1 4Fe-4S dicluster domain-containing protein [Candidatus Frackibacter sp. WG11]SEM31613.1 4Fe-4S dicluster domain-containing protein [Candidatus Frackibacter sp. WG12]SFL36547.1 4Fe-4S dicluster domain-containing protein [Candidatus Frackibacter sp. WG13]